DRGLARGRGQIERVGPAALDHVFEEPRLPRERLVIPEIAEVLGEIDRSERRCSHDTTSFLGARTGRKSPRPWNRPAPSRIGPSTSSRKISSAWMHTRRMAPDLFGNGMKRRAS